MESQQVKATFNQVENYLNRNTSISVRIALIKEMVKGLVFHKYAEVGCGDGSIALSLLDGQKQLVLVDFSPNMIERAQRNSPRHLTDRIEYVVEEILAYQSDEKFDLILCVGVLAHVPSIEQLISKLSSLLTDRGYLIVQFTESRSLCGWFSHRVIRTGQGYEMNRISEAFLVPLLEKEHFVLLSKRAYPDSIMWLGRLSVQLAYRLKLLTSRLNLSFLISERILLFKRVLS